MNRRDWIRAAVCTVAAGNLARVVVPVQPALPAPVTPPLDALAPDAPVGFRLSQWYAAEYLLTAEPRRRALARERPGPPDFAVAHRADLLRAGEAVERERAACQAEGRRAVWRAVCRAVAPLDEANRRLALASARHTLRVDEWWDFQHQTFRGRIECRFGCPAWDLTLGPV